MRQPLFFACACALLATPALADDPPGPTSNPLIDFPGHIALAGEVMQHRESRLLPLEEFRTMAAQPDALLLDARAADDYAAGHIEGAVNLPLPAFTAQSLAETVGENFDRPILIYCNNNFSNDVAPVITKVVTVALNIQTMINLYAYGYTNVFELGDVVDFNDPVVRWTAETQAQS